MTSACVCRTSENCKSLVLQDKYNIEIFLSTVGLQAIKPDFVACEQLLAILQTQYS